MSNAPNHFTHDLIARQWRDLGLVATRDLDLSAALSTWQHHQEGHDTVLYLYHFCPLIEVPFSLEEVQIAHIY